MAKSPRLQPDPHPHHPHSIERSRDEMKIRGKALVLLVRCSNLMFHWGIFETFATNCNDPPYYSQLGSGFTCASGGRNGWFVSSSGLKDLLEGDTHLSSWLWLRHSSCSGHHSPTKVVNHVLQCGNSKLWGNKSISMLMNPTPLLPKEINLYTFFLVLLPKIQF